MRDSSPILLSILAAAALVGCATEPPSRRDLVADPGLSSSGASRDTRFLGYLAFDTVKEGGFVRDNQFDGYGFYARKSAAVTVEIPAPNTKRRLDTTLFVYGPLDAGHVKEIAWDDDGGPGSLSKIANLVIPADGEYLAVVGTALGTGRGAYDVALWCDAINGCDPADDRPAGCEVAISDWVDTCTWKTMPADGTQEDLLAAFQSCTDGAAVEQSYDALCKGEGGLAGIFCGSFEGYRDSTWAACAGVLTPNERPIVK